MSQRLTLDIGGIEAEISLVNQSVKPKLAEYEVQRKSAPDDDPGFTVGRRLPFDPLNDPDDPDDPDDPPRDEPVAIAVAAPSSGVMRGVTGPHGFVDLTDQLQQIDVETKLKGLVIDWAVAQQAIPMNQVRGAHFIVPAGAGSTKVLGLVWDALRRHGRAGMVRWTKKTNQSLGAIVARGGGNQGPRRLELLELEWSDNMREVPERSSLDHVHTALSSAEKEAAARLLVSFHAPPSTVEQLRDTRMARRLELLEAARAGRKLPGVPAPRPTVSAVEDLRELLSA